MIPFGTLYLNRVREAVGVDPRPGQVSAAATADPAAIEAAIASGQPTLLAAIGIIGLVVFGWLMIAKPF